MKTLNDQINSEMDAVREKVNLILLSLDFMELKNNEPVKLEKELKALRDLNKRLSNCFE